MDLMGGTDVEFTGMLGTSLEPAPGDLTLSHIRQLVEQLAEPCQGLSSQSADTSHSYF